MGKLKLSSIDDEAAACRKAFKGVKIGALTLHCHHEVLGESLIEDPENRISYILTQKPEHERALRLRLFRPVSDSKLKKYKKAYADQQKASADYQKAYADYQKAYADQQKASADYLKVCADYQKASADYLKACADYQKASADYQKACADYQKAYADQQKASADYLKACADYQKASADYQKACADYQKASADYQKACADLAILIHSKNCCLGCPWNGKTIFPK